MKKKFNLSNVKAFALVMLVLALTSCTKEETSEVVVEASVDQNTSSQLSSKESLLIECLEPNLPTTNRDVQSCIDKLGTNALNPGKLDVRVTNCAQFGYTETEDRIFGVYRINGSTERFPNTKTRVERFFSSFYALKNFSASFEGKFRIEDLSSDHSVIAQAHGYGLILSGLQKGKYAHSAMFLVRARKKPGSALKYLIDIEYALKPYYSVKEHGSTIRGERAWTESFEINKSTIYKIVMKTGFNANLLYFTNVKFYNSENALIKTIIVPHSYTPTKGHVSYGCYSASDTEDTTSEVRWRNVYYCQSAIKF